MDHLPRFMLRLAIVVSAIVTGSDTCCGQPSQRNDGLAGAFKNPPPAARPGVYWYFMDGNLSRDGMTADLESMRDAGIGNLVFLEVNVGVPRGAIDFLSDRWQELFAHAVREAERLGIDITLGSGPGWAGSGGPWVKLDQSMQHLVASTVTARGPSPFDEVLARPAPRKPFFGEGSLSEAMREQRALFYRDVAVLAFPTPCEEYCIADIDEKALYYRAPYSSRPDVKPYLPAPAKYAVLPPGMVIDRTKIIDLTNRLKPNGRLVWEVPAGEWTIMRFGRRNNGSSTRPAPQPGIGFECDKFDAAALDAHFENYVGRLLRKVGKRDEDRGWTMLHIDSWEMGAQNWTARFRDEFQHRRGYDPLPFLPAYVGRVVASLELSERFPWDVSFDPQPGAPEETRFTELADWTEQSDPTIKYYSGIATYRRTFDLPESLRETAHKVLLDLGSVHNMARVRLNGHDLSVVWCAPWHVDITSVSQAVGNRLEIEVANLWTNRLIGDKNLPPGQRVAETNFNPYQADSPLLPSGLLGPVTLKTAESRLPQ